MRTLEKISDLQTSKPETASQELELQRLQSYIDTDSCVGPLLVGATVQLSLFEWQNKLGVWYIDTRPKPVGQTVLRLSSKVPSDFKGLKEEVIEVSPAMAAKLKLNERFAGQC